MAQSEVFLDVDRRAKDMIAVDPELVLEGSTPRLIDEWQTAPVIWNHVRRAVDARVGKGHFILTGSAVPPDDITRHTGAGRILRLRLRPMSLYELGYSTGQVSLSEVLAGQPVTSPSTDLSVQDLAELICVGGWPGHLNSSFEEAIRVNRSYVADICRADIQRVDGVRRDPERVRRFLQSLARNVATLASLATIARDRVRTRPRFNDGPHGQCLPGQPGSPDGRGRSAGVADSYAVPVPVAGVSETSLR